VGDADASDDFHSSAPEGIEAIRHGRTPMALTTDFVIDEVVTILGMRKGFGSRNAVKVANSVLASPRVLTVDVDEALYARLLSTL
jgi:predicted nucleic acid-binding protein